MDQIRSSFRLQSRSFIIDGPRKFYPSRETIFEDFTTDSEEQIPNYKLTEMQRRKKHFDEFKKLYNNKLEEREARKKAEEEEQQDEFLQHPISKLLSKYGFTVPKAKLSTNSLRSHRMSEFKRSRYRSADSRSRSGSRSGSRGKENDRLLDPDVSFSDMEIVDIYQRHMNGEMEARDKYMNMSTANIITGSPENGESRRSNKLREEIAELEDRFNCILKSFKKTFPRHSRTQFMVKSCDDDSQE